MATLKNEFYMDLVTRHPDNMYLEVVKRIVNNINRKNELDTRLNALLRTLEHLCISCKHGVLDEEIFKITWRILF